MTHRLGLLALIFAAASCLPRQSSAPTPVTSTVEPQSAQFKSAMASARMFAEVEQFTRADSVLSAFEKSHTGTVEAAETLYWRALFALDPTNVDSLRPTPEWLLDRYVGSPLPVAHKTEAQLIRRLAGSVSTLRTALLSRPQGSSATTAGDSTEVSRLKAELQKTKEELERLKKRLIPPPMSPD